MVKLKKNKIIYRYCLKCKKTTIYEEEKTGASKVINCLLCKEESDEFDRCS